MIIQSRTMRVALTCTQEQKSTQSFNITNSIEVTIIGVIKGGEAGVPNRNTTNDKNVTKKSCFFSFSFF